MSAKRRKPNVSNHNPASAFAVNVDIDLQAVMDLSDAEADDARGFDDQKGTVSELPLGETGARVWFKLGTIPLLTLSSKKRDATVGRVLRAIAEGFERESTERQEDFGLGDFTPDEIRIERLEFVGDEGLWLITTNLDGKVEGIANDLWKPADKISDKEWNSLQEQLGVPLPDAMRRFYESERSRWIHYRVPSWEKLFHLQDFDYFSELRILPLFFSMGDDCLGLYFPREGGDPFAVFCFPGETIFPVTADFTRLFKDPEHFSDWDIDTDEHKEVPRDKSGPWERWMIDPNASETPELEFMKPFVLQEDWGSEEAERKLGDLWSRFGTDDPISCAIAECLPDLRQTLSVEQWMRLSEKLLKIDQPREAIRSLENGLVLCSASPQYGFPGVAESKVMKKSDQARQKMWKRLRKLLVEHGDRFDQTVIARMPKSI